MLFKSRSNRSPVWVEDLVASVFVGGDWQDVAVGLGVSGWSSEGDLQESILASVDEAVAV